MSEHAVRWALEKSRTSGSPRAVVTAVAHICDVDGEGSALIAGLDGLGDAATAHLAHARLEAHQ